MQRQSTVEVATNRASHTAAGNSPSWCRACSRSRSFRSTSDPVAGATASMNTNKRTKTEEGSEDEDKQQNEDDEEDRVERAAGLATCVSRDSSQGYV